MGIKLASRTNGMVLKMHIADAVKAPIIIISCKSVTELIHQHANQLLQTLPDIHASDNASTFVQSFGYPISCSGLSKRLHIIYLY